MVKLAINGFGRIGRAAFKVAFEKREDIEVVAINDLGDINNLAYLLRYDSVYGRYAQPVAVRDGALIVGDRSIAVFQEKEPNKLPWKKLGVDVVIESTGFFTEEEKARLHLTAGANYVIISAPTASESVATVVAGVNDKEMQGRQIISNASCTTNCTSSVTAVIERAFGIEQAMMTTAHAYTATQSLVDGPATKDMRRGRAAAINIVPSATGAAEAVIRTLPHLKGKFDGIAVRVPVAVVSLSDFTFVVKTPTTREEVNQVLRDSAENPLYRGVIAVTDEPTVSSDFIGDPHSAIVDLNLTRVVGGKLVKVMAWYDNEWGYSNRLVEQALALSTQTSS